MNRIYKVIWSKAKCCYVVVSEIARSTSKGTSKGKTLARLALAALLAGTFALPFGGGMAVEASELDSGTTSLTRYVAFKGDPVGSGWSHENGNLVTTNTAGEKVTYYKDAKSGYWVREGYKISISNNGYTPLNVPGQYTSDLRADVHYVGDTGKKPKDVLEAIQSMDFYTGTKTNIGESLNGVKASGFTGVVNSPNTPVMMKDSFVIEDTSWLKDDEILHGDQYADYKDGWVNLQAWRGAPNNTNGNLKGFVTVDTEGGKLKYDANMDRYEYNGEVVDYSNLYVLTDKDGKTHIGVFTNYDGSEYYKGAVYGMNNEVIRTVKKDGKLYTFWGAAVTDESLTMDTYRIADYNKDLKKLTDNDDMLYRNDIKEVTMAKSDDGKSATIGLLRNGETPTGGPEVPGTITVTASGGTDGNDTKVTLSNESGSIDLATGSVVKATTDGTSNTATQLTINGITYDLAQGNSWLAAAEGTQVAPKDNQVNLVGAKTKDADGNETDHKNIEVSKSADGEISFGLNADLKLQNVTANTITSQTVNAGNMYVTNVDVNNGGSVINKSYFDANRVHIKQTTDANPYKVDKNGNVVMDYVTGDGNVRTDIHATITGIARDDLTNITEGGKTVVNNIAKDAVKVIDGKNTTVTADKIDGANGKVTTYAVNVEANGQIVENNKNIVTGDTVYKALQEVSWNAKVDGNQVKEVKKDGSLNFVSGDHISITNENGDIKISAKDLDGLGYSGWKVSANHGTGVDVAEGNTVDFSNTDKNVKISQDGTNLNVDLADNVNVKGSLSAASGAFTVAADGTTWIQGKTTITDGSAILGVQNGVASLTAGKGNNRIEVNEDNILVNGLAVSQKDGDGLSQISNVKAGVADTDAVNVGQLKKAQTEVTVNGGTAAGEEYNTDGNLQLKKSTGADGQSVYDVKLSDRVQLGGDNDFITLDGTKGTIWATGDVVVGAAPNASVSINAGDQTITGLSNTTIGYAGFATTGKAATEEQLKALKLDVDGSAYKGWMVSANGKGGAAVASGDKVDFSNSDGNILISQEGTNLTLDLSKDLHLDKVTTNVLNSTKIYVTDVDVNNGDSVINKNYFETHSMHIRPTTEGDEYTIDDKGNVTMTYVDGAGNLVDGVQAVIKDVAKKSDLDKVETLAGKHTTLTEKDGNLIVTKTDKDGQLNYDVALNKDLDLTEDGSVTMGNTVLNGQGLHIGGSGASQIVISQTNISMGGQQVHNVAAGTVDTDAVNVGQLKQAVSEGDTHIKAGDYAVNDKNQVSMDIVDGKGNVTGNVTITDVAKSSDVGDINNFNKNVLNQDGSKTTVVDAINNIDNRVTNIDNRVTEIEKTAGKHSSVANKDGNITVEEGTNELGGKEYTVGLNKEKIDLGGVTIEGNKGNISVNGSVSAGNTSISNDGVKVGDKTSLTEKGLTIGGNTYITGDGINANSQKITNVADGEISATSKDAVNGSQLYATNQQVNQNTQNIVNLHGDLNRLDSRVNRVGAGAAALAALQPLDFDPDAKWDFSAGYGNYNGANAVAVGAYYRPNEDLMFSVGGSMGGGENMVNAGVSIKLGAGSSNVNMTKIAMAKEIKDLRKELESLKSALLDVHAGKPIDTSKLQLFPDVEQNHWAYEYVSQLAGNGIIEGYPDGNFSGDRPMTRYEFAAMLYRAMMKGAVLSDRILTEFAPELERFTVDTIHTDKDGNPTVERVRLAKPAADAEK